MENLTYTPSEYSGQESASSIAPKPPTEQEASRAASPRFVPDTSLSTSKTTYTSTDIFIDAFSQLETFYDSKSFCDINLVCEGGQTIPCHKVILASTIPYFRSMFTSNMAESYTDTIEVREIDPAIMRTIVDGVYSGRCAIDTENVQAIFCAASFLQMNPLMDACCDFMEKNLDLVNCSGVHQLATVHHNVQLIQVCEEFLFKNFEEYSKLDEFLSLPSDVFKKLLASDDVNVPSEQFLLESLIRWIRSDSTERINAAPELLRSIRMSQLSVDYLYKMIEEECGDLFHSIDCWKQWSRSIAAHLTDLGLLTVRPMTLELIPRKSYAGVLFCIGGRGEMGNPFRSVEGFDLRSNSWFHVPEMIHARRHVGVIAIDGKVYAIGGHDGREHLQTVEVFEPAKKKWKLVQPMSSFRRGIAVGSLPNGHLYAVGGLDDTTCYKRVERYDPVNDLWENVEDMNTPRGGVGVIHLNGFLYACGGNDGNESLSSCERYEPVLNKWTMIASMNHRRAGAGYVAINGSIYAVGGFDDAASLSSAEVYDPQTDRWTLIESMSSCRGGVGVAALAGKVYAVGGHDGNAYLKTVEAYDILSGRWNPCAQINTCRAGAGVTYSSSPVETIRGSATSSCSSKEL